MKPIERCVQMWCEQQAIDHVETLAVAFAIRPRLDMAGTKHLRNGHPRDSTSAVPIIDQACSKDVLPDTLYDKSLGFSRPRERRGRSHERMQQLIRQRFG